MLKAGDHPYWTAYIRGFETVAETWGMEKKVYNSNWSIYLQAQQTDQAINERPDMIIFAPVDAADCALLLRRIYAAGIPCITSNTIPSDAAMQYCLAWTGPDDWGQFRMLARVFADVLGKRGGYAVVRHMPGSSPFFARTYAPITELVEYAPDMELLAMDTANLEAEATGMDSVKAGEALAISYQSVEGDEALAIHSAARWFNGESLEPVIHLPKQIITQKLVDEYMPAQW